MPWIRIFSPKDTEPHWDTEEFFINVIAVESDEEMLSMKEAFQKGRPDFHLRPL